MTPEPLPDMYQDDDRDTIDPDTLRESGWRDYLAFAAWGAALALFVAIGVFAGNVASFEADRIMHPGAWE